MISVGGYEFLKLTVLVQITNHPASAIFEFASERE